MWVWVLCCDDVMCDDVMWSEAGIAVSNFGGDYVAGTDSNDYSEDLEKRMVRHRLYTQQSPHTLSLCCTLPRASV